jgi:hypothetical protein
MIESMIALAKTYVFDLVLENEEVMQ